jgi:hypothetical protein
VPSGVRDSWRFALEHSGEYHVRRNRLSAPVMQELGEVTAISIFVSLPSSVYVALRCNVCFRSLIIPKSLVTHAHLHMQSS